MSIKLKTDDLLDDASLPMYQRIKNTIRYKVQEGEWLPGTQIVSENQLALGLNVNPKVVNRSFRELAHEGLLRHVHGQGTFVSIPIRQGSLVELRSIAAESAVQGKEHFSKMLLLESIKATEPIAQQMECIFGECLFHTVILHFQSNIPIQIEDRYVHPEIVPDFMKVNFAEITPADYLINLLKPDEIEHRVQAILPNTFLAMHLDIPEHEPCLRLKRRTWYQGRVVTSVDLTYPGSRYDLASRYIPTE